MSVDDDKISPKQAAKLLGVTTKTLRNYAKLPGFPPRYYLTPKNVKYSRAELLAWIEARRSAGDAES